MVKPFSPTELAARIRAALRKRAAPELAEPTQPYVRGDLTVDYPQRRVTVAGRIVALTAIEYRMLVELSANAGRPLTHEHLLQRVWGPDKGTDSAPVRNIVKRLRRKLDDDPDNPGYIFAEPTVGYRMELGEAPETGDWGATGRSTLAVSGICETSVPSKSFPYAGFSCGPLLGRPGACAASVGFVVTAAPPRTGERYAGGQPDWPIAPTACSSLPRPGRPTPARSRSRSPLA